MTALQSRSEVLFCEDLRKLHARTDRMFAVLMGLQFFAGLIVANWISPLTWSGPLASSHVHLWAAFILGGVISAVPIGFALLRPGQVLTRHVIAVGQALSSALLIHLSGGRIETHFHVFGSLAFLAFYRDWRVIVSATLVIAGDHMLRGIFWPQSVFGVLTASNWRWIEHAGWVVFEDVILLKGCVESAREMRQAAQRQAELELRNELAQQQAALQAELRDALGTSEVCAAVVARYADWTGASLGALYLFEAGALELQAGYALSEQAGLATRFREGEGLVGQAARRDDCFQRSIAEAPLELETGLGRVELDHVLFVPLSWQGARVALVVLGRRGEFSEGELELAEKTREAVAAYLKTAQDKVQTQRLLERTRAQTLELEEQNEAIHRQRAALDLKNRELEAASKHKSDFLASMSHELRTPLNAMIGYTSLTLAGCADVLPPKHLRNLERAERAAGRLLELLNNVLDFSKIEAGQMEVHLHSFPLADLLEELGAVGEGLVATREGLEFHIEDRAPGLVLTSDFTRLNQILINLIGNGIKVTEAGEVRVYAEVHGGHLRLEVRDTGPGIPEEARAAVFESFRQLDSTTKRKVSGTGLGLAICRRLTALIGGELGFESEVGVGTTFWLELPLEVAPVQAPAALALPGALTQGEPAPQAPAPSRALKHRVALSGIFLHEVPEPARLLAVVNPETQRALEEAVEGLPLAVIPCEPKDLPRLLSQGSVWGVATEAPSLAEVAAADPRLASLPVLLCEQGVGEAPRGRLVRTLTKPLQRDELVAALLEVSRVPGEVLVVDDDPDTLALHAQILREGGFSPQTATNGEEALARLQASSSVPRAIVLDLLMPKLDGFSVLAELEARPAWRHLPVIVVSGKRLSAEERQMLAEAGHLLLEKGKVSASDLPSHVGEVVAAVSQAAANKVLVVDDNLMNLEVAEGILSAEGYTVRCASSGVEALELAEELAPDLVLMDLSMPGMDGFEATRALRGSAVAGEAVVIACSAFSVEDFRERAREAGCDAFLNKPLDPGRLVHQIRACAIAAKARRLNQPLIPSLTA